MKNLLIIMNHELTKEQLKELTKKFGPVGGFLRSTMPIVPPTAKKQEVYKMAEEIIENWLSSDIAAVVVQGEPGLTFAIVNKLKERGVVCLHATTERCSVEKTLPDGSVQKTNVFKHVQFREY